MRAWGAAGLHMVQRGTQGWPLSKASQASATCWGVCRTAVTPPRTPPPRSKVLSAINKEVKEFYGGSHSTMELSASTGVIVCTIEKANNM